MEHEHRARKTYQEWQRLVSDLNPIVFEELCYRIVRSLGYENVNWIGGSADGGRDIEGEKTRLEEGGVTSYVEKYWFECKCYSSSIPWKAICEKIHSAKISGIDKFVILSNMGLSPDAQNKINLFCETEKMRIFAWCGFHFLDLLFQFPDLCAIYFPGEGIPNIPPIDSKPKYILEVALKTSEDFGIELKTQIDPNIPITEGNLNKVLFDALRNLKCEELGISVTEKAKLFSGIAMTFLQFGFENDALSFIDKSLQIEKSNLTLENKALILSRMGLLEESNELYGELIKENDNPRILTNWARNLRQEYRLEEAFEKINQALKIEDNYIDAIRMKSILLKDINHFDEALDFLNEKIKLNSSLALNKVKVEVLIDVLDLKAAYELNENLLKSYPYDCDLVNNKGVIYERNSKYQKRSKYLELAFIIFGEAIKINPEYLLAISNQIICFLNSNQLDNAEKLVNVALIKSCKDPYLIEQKAKIEMRKGENKIALKIIDRSLKITINEKFLLTKAQILFNLKKYDKAINICKEILKNDDSNPEPMKLIADSLEKTRNPHLAKKWREKAKLNEIKPRSLLEDS
jgi:tetratricopeptide (TPR) repeat protein